LAAVVINVLCAGMPEATCRINKTCMPAEFVI
jgi:hypothetical protein